MKHVTPEELRAMNAQMDRCTAELADAQCDVVTTACLVAIMSIYSVESVLTFNSVDFERFTNVRAIHPSSLHP